MSAVRQPDDLYVTPSWTVTRLLEHLWLPGGDWLEPSAGTGAIIQAVNGVRAIPVNWTACEINHDHKPALSRVVDGPNLHMGVDFTDRDFGGTEFDVLIGNPPYSLAMEFIDAALPISSFVVLLLRLNFLSSSRRVTFFRSEMPDVYVLPNRPSFVHGKTDMTEYGWFVWTPERGRSWGRQCLLSDTPKERR